MNRRLAAAALSGLVLPGAGQVYNGQRLKGALLAGATLVILAAALYITWDAAVGILLGMPPGQSVRDIYGLARVVFDVNRVLYLKALAGLLAIWVYGVVDAYICAGGACPKKGTT